MANTRPPLQLQFTVQGEKQVLPMTAENVEAVFKTADFTYLAAFLHIPADELSSPGTAARWWMTNYGDRRWRVMIYYLDWAGETGLADELMPFCEPPSDSSLTVDQILPVFIELEDWTSLGYVYDVVPNARAGVIRHKYTSHDGQRRQGAAYYVNVYPWASWGDLAGQLYEGQENQAIKAFKAQLPKLKNPTLTVENIMNATDGIEIPEVQSGYDYLDMPEDTYESIVEECGTGDEGKKEIFTEFLSHHPYPRWELVVELLEILERNGEARAGLAQKVKEKYLTSIRSLFNLCVGHIVNNYEFYQPLLPQLLPHHIHTHITSLPAWKQRSDNAA